MPEWGSNPRSPTFQAGSFTHCTIQAPSLKMSHKKNLENVILAQCFNSYYRDMRSFHPLEVVGRGSETQLQVGEELNYFP